MPLVTSGARTRISCVRVCRSLADRSPQPGSLRTHSAQLRASSRSGRDRSSSVFLLLSCRGEIKIFGKCRTNVGGSMRTSNGLARRCCKPPRTRICCRAGRMQPPERRALHPRSAVACGSQGPLSGPRWDVAAEAPVVNSRLLSLDSTAMSSSLACLCYTLPKSVRPISALPGCCCCHVFCPRLTEMSGS